LFYYFNVTLIGVILLVRSLLVRNITDRFYIFEEDSHRQNKIYIK